MLVKKLAFNSFEEFSEALATNGLLYGNHVGPTKGDFSLIGRRLFIPTEATDNKSEVRGLEISLLRSPKEVIEALLWKALFSKSGFKTIHWLVLSEVFNKQKRYSEPLQALFETLSLSADVLPSFATLKNGQRVRLKVSTFMSFQKSARQNTVWDEKYFTSLVSAFKKAGLIIPKLQTELNIDDFIKVREGLKFQNKPKAPRPKSNSAFGKNKLHGPKAETPIGDPTDFSYCPNFVLQRLTENFRKKNIKLK